MKHLDNVRQNPVDFQVNSIPTKSRSHQMPMDYISLCRWLCTIVLLFLFFPISKAYSRSITLEESLQHALSHNEALQIVREDLDKSHQRIRHAVADVLPQFDITLQYTRNWLLPTFFFDTPAGQQQFTVGAHNNLIGTVGIRQAIWGGGKSFSAMRVARLFRQFSMEKVRAAKQQVHTQVETAFYDLLLAGELTHVSKSSMARARANFRRVEKLREAGRVSDYDLLRAQVQVAELLTDSIRTENARVLADLAFKNLIGIDPNEPITPHGTFREKIHHLPTEDEAVLIDLSKHMNSIVRQHRLEVEMLQYAESIAQAESRPTIDLIVNGQWQAQKNEFDFVKDDFHQSWFSGIAINIPIFDGFRTNAQVAQARSDTRQAELVEKKTERDVRFNVLQAWRTFLEVRARKSAQIQALDLARRGLQIAESRYENGVGTQIEVIDGQLTLQRAEAELARAKRDLAVTLVHLELSMGILGEDKP